MIIDRRSEIQLTLLFLTIGLVEDLTDYILAVGSLLKSRADGRIWKLRRIWKRVLVGIDELGCLFSASLKCLRDSDLRPTFPFIERLSVI